MIQYRIALNNGNENIGVTHKTISVAEQVKACDARALATEIHHQNPLIPEQVARDVMDNFCVAVARLMAMGFSIHLKHEKDVAIRLYPDVHINGGSITLAKAKQLDESVTDLTLDNAASLVHRAGVYIKPRAEFQPKFNTLLHEAGAKTQAKGVVERAKIKKE